MLTVVTEDDARADDAAAGLDEIIRDGARRMLAAAIEAEAAGYLEALTGELDEHGHRLVVRNGHAEPRTITVWADGIHFNVRLEEDRLCAWSSWVCAPTGPRSCGPSRTATGSRPRSGRTRCGT
jgi:hypothetical protein